VLISSFIAESRASVNLQAGDQRSEVRGQVGGQRSDAKSIERRGKGKEESEELRAES
jgi:hypothetical protein